MLQKERKECVMLYQDSPSHFCGACLCNGLVIGTIIQDAKSGLKCEDNSYAFDLMLNFSLHHLVSCEYILIKTIKRANTVCYIRNKKYYLKSQSCYNIFTIVNH